MPLIRTATELDFSPTELPRTPRPKRILLADPRDYDVHYAINPHMVDEDGELQVVDRELAREQWQALHRACSELDVELMVMPPLAQHPDLVFCANPALPLPPGLEGPEAAVLPSQMASSERADEVHHMLQFLRSRGVTCAPALESAAPLEGTGDGLWHPGRRLLWAGVGPRSDERAWAELAERYDLPIILLNLADPDFYHLDTCLALLDEEHCLWFPEAFDAAGRGLVELAFPKRLVAPEDEARRRLACNLLCPDGHTVLLPSNCPESA
ncbi:MAG: amidinotransferase, partial [Planctomycetota bacterium]|nr:amidinotransferase [Planctomycetota bacterium]